MILDALIGAAVIAATILPFAGLGWIINRYAIKDSSAGFGVLLCTGVLFVGTPIGLIGFLALVGDAVRQAAR